MKATQKVKSAQYPENQYIINSNAKPNVSIISQRLQNSTIGRVSHSISPMK